MQVRFWGTRGSLAKPGPDTIRYGGNTSCIEVRSDSGTLVILDCGTGAHNLGQSLMASPEQPLSGHLLISHTHWDHIQGIPFFEPFFKPENQWDIYAPHNLDQSVRETLAGQMQYNYFPVTIEALGAKIAFHDLVEGSFEVGDITVRTSYLNHTALAMGYRLECDGVAVVYACDHEPYPRGQSDGVTTLGSQNMRHVEFLRDADLVIHDAQYTATEYKKKVGWGHSSHEYAIDVCREAGVRQLALTHHDPLRTDDQVDEIIERLKKNLAGKDEELNIFAAAEGETIKLTARPGADRSGRQQPSAVQSLAPTTSTYSVLLAEADAETARRIKEAVKAENMQLIAAEDTVTALTVLENETPSLVIIDETMGSDKALAICQKVKELATGMTPQAPIVLVVNDENTPHELAELSTDRIVRPFSVEYMRTRLRAWILRSASRWVRGRRPDNEAERLAALRKLGILDTEPEERFDRIVKLAAEALNVPIALVSLIDHDRQWFKSCLGLDTRETSRDLAFCAHAILENDVMIVPDAFLDARFADNPLVTGDVRVRFYAGCPLRLPDGHVVGTLCLIDSRPRQFDSQQINLLKGFAAMAEQELVRKPGPIAA